MTDFEWFMRDMGDSFCIPEGVVADGELHSCDIVGELQGTGFYLYVPGKVPVGIYGCWKPFFLVKWSPKAHRHLTGDEKFMHQFTMKYSVLPVIKNEKAKRCEKDSPQNIQL